MPARVLIGPRPQRPARIDDGRRTTDDGICRAHVLTSIVHRLSSIAGPLSLLALLLLAGCSAGSGGSGDKVKLVVTPVDTPTSTPLAAPTMAPTTYTVKSGDTLSGIAALFGVTVDDIVRANNIADPNTLSDGQVLTIPVRSGGTASEATATPKAGSPGPPTSPTLPPPDVTPPLGPPVTDQPSGAASPGVSPTAAP
ncbi:MAG: LysM peptidoglycan-binding domain-containing protein [Chloroflexia bacterium]